MVLAGCSTASSGTVATGGRLRVVVAESAWGSLASQLGGDRVEVTSLIDSPDVDPHDFEPNAQDARAIASARYVVFNGLGYDSWTRDLLDANPVDGRRVLEIGARLGRREGDNPHRWYFPADVATVIAQITEDYKALDPASAAYFDEQRRQLELALGPYHALLDEIRQRFAGVPIGASESIVAGIAEATGLDLRTPPGYLLAISEGTEPTAEDKAIVDEQVARREVAVLVENSQNGTPDVQALVASARANGVPVTSVTETLPPGARFQDWQADQLRHLADALATARGA